MQIEPDVGVAPVKLAERFWQAYRGRAFHGAEVQRAAWLAVVNRVPRFLCKIEKPVGVIKENCSRRRKVQTPAFPDEQLDAELLFELPHTRRDVLLDAVEVLGRTRNAALAHDRPENLQIGKVHRSRSEIIFILVIHFT